MNYFFSRLFSVTLTRRTEAGATPFETKPENNFHFHFVRILFLLINFACSATFDGIVQKNLLFSISAFIDSLVYETKKIN